MVEHEIVIFCSCVYLLHVCSGCVLPACIELWKCHLCMKLVVVVHVIVVCLMCIC